MNNIILNTYINNEIVKVKFVAVIDEKTSDICEGMNGQIFYLNQKEHILQVELCRQERRQVFY